MVEGPDLATVTFTGPDRTGGGMKYLKITMNDGSEHVSAFRKLALVGKYIREVLAGKKRLNVWTVVGETLPSGERNLQRTRVVLNHEFVRKIEEVKPKADWNKTDFDASNFEPVVLPTPGKAGYWVAPTGLPGLTGGTVYPHHVDESSQRKYIITAVTDADGPTKYFTDGLGEDGHRVNGVRGIAGTTPQFGTSAACDDDDDF
jgi:hypothetical protein